MSHSRTRIFAFSYSNSLLNLVFFVWNPDDASRSNNKTTNINIVDRITHGTKMVDSLVCQTKSKMLLCDINSKVIICESIRILFSPSESEME